MIGAQRLNFTFLQGTQQLRLQAQGHVTDLVQKQGATVGQLEFSVTPLSISASESAGRNAKKLCLQQGFWHRRNVDADQRPPGTRRAGVDGMGQQLFTRARFPQQQNGTVGLGGSPGLAFQIGDHRTGPHKTGETVTSLTQSWPSPSLRGQSIACLVQLPLHQGKFRHQGLQIGFWLLKQHHTQSANDHTRVIPQGKPADQKGSRSVREQIDEDGLARFHHLTHLGVLHHLHHGSPHKIFLFLEPQGGQVAPVVVIDPNHTTRPIHQQHSFTGVGKHIKQ